MICRIKIITLDIKPFYTSDYNLVGIPTKNYKDPEIYIKIVRKFFSRLKKQKKPNCTNSNPHIILVFNRQQHALTIIYLYSTVALMRFRFAIKLKLSTLQVSVCTWSNKIS